MHLYKCRYSFARAGKGGGGGYDRAISGATAPEAALTQPDSILLVDDHPVFRLGMRHVLAHRFPRAPLAEAGTFDEALLKAQALRPAPALFVLDLMLPGFAPDTGIPLLRGLYPRAVIVVLSMAEAAAYVDQVMRAGADGFVGKSVPPDEIAAAIESICDGEILVRTAPSLLGGEALVLSPRQREVLALLEQGKSNKEIGAELGISPLTARMHVSALMRVLGVDSRTAIVARASRWHLPR
ncbi:response regulator transcription factor [Castellaniella defragrans]|nr:response regulator transcription factor [Castellaniella defragrans]